MAFFFWEGEKHHRLGNLGGLEIRISTSHNSKMQCLENSRCVVNLHQLYRKNGTLYFPGGFFASIFRHWHGICLGYFSSLPSIWKIEDLGFDHRIEGHLEALQEGWFLMGFWFLSVDVDLGTRNSLKTKSAQEFLWGFFSFQTKLGNFYVR